MTEESVSTGVSPAAEQKLRSAMSRLLGGTTNRTDGRLTKNNLCAEAGVSRATMNRANKVMLEWDSAVTDTRPRDHRTAELDDEIARLKRLVSHLREKNTNLGQQNQAAVTVIAELNAQLRVLRDEEPGGTIVSFYQRSRSPD